MHLLNVTTKRLESFYGNEIPRYAILSHMWGKEEDEVLFKHIAGSDDDRHKGESRKGYAKLVAACEQAIRDGWQYIWIDTCCIDKQSSAELSEAINSMYAWYRGSEVCYAYLEDVQNDKEAQSDDNATFKVVPFEESRWFSRGWTLQELIAPRRVVFYSSDWIDIGTKAYLRDAISAVTDIRVEMITNYDPDKASVAEKMSWAAKRQTTRDEDIAYCLIGLLGVNMPLLYGEGTRAFRRLQEEIMKVSDDHSIFAWKTTHSRYGDRLKLLTKTRGMLADSPSNFLGVGNVVQSNNEGPYPAYYMNNKGLQIGLPIRPIDPKELIDTGSVDSQDIFKAILDCTYRDTNSIRWVVIYLKMVGKGRYVRIFPHWLDDTHTNPNEAEADGWTVTSLLVPQVNTSSMTKPTHSRHLKLKILPTGSGYRYKGESLVKGRESYHSSGGVNVFIFGREGKQFSVVIGFDGKGVDWMDIIKEDDFEHESNLTTTSKRDVINKIKLLYEKGGSRHHVVLQHLNLLCVNVSKDHSVDVSGKIAAFGSKSCYEITIDIRKIIIQVPFPIYIEGNFLDDLDPRNVHPNSKKEGVDWFAIFNSTVEKALDISHVRSLDMMDEDAQARMHSIFLFSHDGKYLATTTDSTDCVVYIYDTMSGYITCVLSNESVQGFSPCCMCFSPNGNFLAIGTRDGCILLWDITKKHVHRDFTSHQSEIKTLKFSPDSQLIVSVPERGMVQISDIVSWTSKDICRLGHRRLTFATISPGDRLVAGAHGAVIRIWDLEINRLVGILRGHSEDVKCIAFTPDGKGLVSGSADKTLKYWDIGGLTDVGFKWRQGYPDGNTVPRMPVDRDVDRPSQHIMDIKHKYAVSDVAVSYDGNWIISVSRGNIQFWDLRDGTIQFMFQKRLDSVNSFQMSPTGNILAIYANQSRVTQIWKYSNIIDRISYFLHSTA